MPINTKYTLAYPDPQSMTISRSLYRGSRQRAILCPFQINNTDATGTKIYVGKIPSSAIILPSSQLYYGAVTGCSINFGTAEVANAFLSAKSVASAGSTQAIAAVAIGNQSKRVWELAGLSVDPGRQMDLIIALTADASPGSPVDLLLQLDYNDEV